MVRKKKPAKKISKAPQNETTAEEVAGPCATETCKVAEEGASANVRASPTVTPQKSKALPVTEDVVPKEESEETLFVESMQSSLPIKRLRGGSRRNVGAKPTPKSASKATLKSSISKPVIPNDGGDAPTNDNIENSGSSNAEQVTPKSKRPASTPASKGSNKRKPKTSKISPAQSDSPQGTSNKTEFVTPKARGPGRKKGSSNKTNRSQKSNTEQKENEVKTESGDNDDNGTMADVEDTTNETRFLTPQARVSTQKKGSSGKISRSQKSNARKTNNEFGTEPNSEEGAPQTPADQIATSTPDTGGRSRRSAAIKARQSFLAMSKGLMEDDDGNETDDSGKTGKKKKTQKMESDDDSDADADVKMEEEESSSDEDTEMSSEESEDSFEDEEEMPRIRIKTHRKAESETPYWDSSDGQLGATIKMFGQFMKSCERSNLFQKWRPKPDHWKRLSNSELATYLPAMRTSSHYRMSYSKLHKGKPEREPDATLNMFQAESTKDHKVCFVGGPIRAMSWCPVPMKEKKVDQLLALYASHHPDFRHTAYQVLQLPSLIQIWSFGNMKDKDASSTMVCGLAVDNGPIHDIKWCPLGAYDDPTSEAQSEYYSRLGILAVAMCDGLVYIYSIPHLHQLPPSEEAEHPVFRVQPVAQLVPSLFHSKGSYGPCMCLDWQWKHSASRIFAGFGRGQIGIWQLDTESVFLLKTADDGTELICPIMSIPGHRDVITSIAVSQNVPDYFSTVSHDRFVKVWDMKRPEALLNQQFRFMMNSVVWPTQLSGNLIAQDYGSGNYWFLDSGYYGAKGKPVVPHMDCVWHISYNPWLRASASVDGDGVLAVTLFPNLLLHRVHSGLYKHSNHAVTVRATIDLPKDEASTEKMSLKQKELEVSSLLTATATAEVKATSDTKENNQQNSTTEDNKQKHIEEASVKARLSFEEIHKSAHLCFRIDTTQDFRKLKYNHFKLIHDMRNLPIQALYTTAWNPNLHWRTWLAFGGQAGLLGVVNLHWHDNKTAGKFT